MVEIGQFVRDTVAGATGEVVAKTFWKYGCIRVTVQPRKLKNSAPVDTFTVDEPQLEVVEGTSQGDVTPTHGDRDDASAVERN